jgi:N-acetylmuramoyl-L-alanine amidase
MKMPLPLTSARSSGVRIARAALFWLGLAFVMTAGPAAHAQVPVASAVRVEETGQGARLVFTLSSPAQAAAYVMAGPDRVIIDVPELNFQLPPRTGQAEAPVKGKKSNKIIASFRFGLFAQGKSRIVVDLGRPALVARVASVSRADGLVELQIELREADPAAFTQAARMTTNEAVARDLMADAPAKPVARPDPRRPMVVIDPGHGGIDAGAQGKKNVIEKDVVFDFSRELKAHLEATGRYRVAMTRNTDIFVPLARRVKIARESGADLFISIHADTISDTGAGVSGATVYTVSDKASDKEAAKLAEKENLADAAAGLEGVDDSGDVSDILFDLTRRETRTYSHAFARTLVNYWSEAGRLNKNPHRSAGFLVLKAPDVPSVLLELGYLSNEKDSASMATSEWRVKAAAAMVRAVDSFFQPRLGGGAEAGRPARPAN